MQAWCGVAWRGDEMRRNKVCIPSIQFIHNACTRDIFCKYNAKKKPYCHCGVVGYHMTFTRSRPSVRSRAVTIFCAAAHCISKIPLYLYLSASLLVLLSFLLMQPLSENTVSRLSSPFVRIDANSDFPLENLPFGIFSTLDQASWDEWMYRNRIRPFFCLYLCTCFVCLFVCLIN